MVGSYISEWGDLTVMGYERGETEYWLAMEGFLADKFFQAMLRLKL